MRACRALIFASDMDLFRWQKPRPDDGLDQSRDVRGLRRNPLVWIAVIGAIVLYSQTEDNSLFGNLNDAGSPKVQLNDVGGPFALTDHSGRRVTNEDFRGRYMLIYFGYSYCPDICPADLLVMGHAVDMLGEDGEKVQPIFITVDPARDTVASLADYVPNFHPRLLGLTGSEAEIASAARAYKAYYRLGDEKEGPDDYPVEHTDYIYLMGPNGEFLDHYQRGLRPAEIAQLIGRHL
jgi:cytochrome oxidase Cu insertion factor (SCO1/SenC/PrrC family)